MRFIALFHATDFMPPSAVTALPANVRTNASARSGLRPAERFLISSFDSICNFPLLVNLYRTIASSLIKLISFGRKQSFFANQSRARYQSSARKLRYVPVIEGASDTLMPRIGRPSSRPRSTTPDPSPIESIRISVGVSPETRNVEAPGDRLTLRQCNIARRR